AAWRPAARRVTENDKKKLLTRNTRQRRAQARRGHDRASDFTRRFVAAGGILKEGSDPPRGMAALLMHQALAMDVEAGVPPMTAIQTTTPKGGKTFRKDKD